MLHGRLIVLHLPNSLLRPPQLGLLLAALPLSCCGTSARSFCLQTRPQSVQQLLQALYITRLMHDTAPSEAEHSLPQTLWHKAQAGVENHNAAER